MPIGFDLSHPFPQVINKSLSFIVELSGNDAFGRSTAIAIVKAPRVLRRVIQLPPELSSRKGVASCLLTSIIHAQFAQLFSGREVMAYSQFRVTRNSDVWVDEEEVKNLRQALQSRYFLHLPARQRQHLFAHGAERRSDPEIWCKPQTGCLLASVS